MPRARYQPKTHTIDLSEPPKVTRLRSTPKARDDEPVALPSSQVLRETVSPIPPSQDLNRTRYGRALNLDRIEHSLRSADFGSMRQITDLSRETIDVDPHLAAILNKRFGAVSALPIEVVPASGLGIDKERARFFADVVRDQIKQLPNFSQRVKQIAWGLFDGRAALENEWLLVPQVPGIPVITHPTYGTVKWMIRDMEWVHPRRIQFGPRRELRIADNQEGNFAPVGFALNDFPMKFVQFAPQLFGDYQEREGLARRCLYWSFFKRTSARERMMLMELFGKPWRWLEVDEDSTADSDDLSQADEQLQQLGGLASFRFPRGTKLNVQQPGKGAGEVHQQVIEESDKQLSKLVLGQTGTTDANPAGLNNAQANVMQDEQFMILLQDAKLVSEAFETYLTDAIIALNFGEEWLPHAPHFVLRADVPLDRSKEIARLDAAVKAGLEIPLSEAYEVSGFRRPENDEPVLKLETPPLHPMAVQPPPERGVIVHPESDEASLPKRVVQPIAPVGEGGLDSPEQAAPTGGNMRAPEGGGTDPTAIPEDDDDDDDEGNGGAGGGGTTGGTGGSVAASGGQVNRKALGPWVPLSPRMESMLKKAHPSDALAIRAMYAFEKAPDKHFHINLEDGDSEDETEEFMVTEQPVNKSEVGTIETTIKRGQKVGARESTKMTKSFVKAVEGLTDAKDIGQALERAAENQSLRGFSRAMERSLLMGAMSGGVSSAWEVQEDESLPTITFDSTKPFTNRPFQEAVRYFKELGVVTRDVFDQLDTAAKRRAFTIAGIHNQRQLEIAKAELERILQQGHSLESFAASLEERFDAAGMTTMNPSHVENVYRTNVVNSYNSGRHAQMTQPEVLRVRSFWQIRTVNDGPPRQRATHQRVHNWVLRADDSIWQLVYPPFGFNCRCRVVSLSNVEVEDRGLRVRSGTEVSNLPDSGFTSGTPSLL